MEQVDKEIIKGLQLADQRAYGILIRLYFQPLTIYAKSIVTDFEQAKDIVQDIFLKIWDTRNSLEVSMSLKAYLYRMVHNACIDYLRKEKSRNNIKSVSYDDIQLRLQVFEVEENDYFFDLLFNDEIEQHLQKAIELLPSQCKEIFLMCRYEHLTYREISEKLALSLSTVKTQMVRAMQKLEETMKDFLK